MEHNDNEQRLRILQERLGQIKNKQQKLEENILKPEQTSPYPTYNPKATQSSDEAITPFIEDEEPRKSIKFPRKIILSLLIISAIAYGGFYIYQNDINFNISAFTPNIMEETEIKADEIIPIKYSLDFGKAKHLIIIASFENEDNAVELVRNKTNEGYASDYFFLPSVSNSKEQFYKVYLGPYLSLSEAKQWKKTLEEIESEILNL